MIDPRRARSSEGWYAVLIVPLTVILVTLLLVFFVFFQSSTVDGPSMQPTLLSSDGLLLTHGYEAPRRGDIVVFALDERGKKVDVVKRIVAIPGDVVVTKGDLAWVNGRPEPKGYDIMISKSDEATVGPLRVPPGELFVLGDNRAVSLDSRYVGLVSMRSVIGRAVAIFSPVTRIRLLRLPSS